MGRFGNIDEITEFYNQSRAWYQPVTGRSPLTDEEWAAQLSPPAGERTGYYYQLSSIPGEHPEWLSDPMANFEALENAAYGFDYSKPFPGYTQGGPSAGPLADFLYGSQMYQPNMTPEEQRAYADSLLASFTLSQLVNNPDAEQFLSGRGVARALREQRFQKTGPIRPGEEAPGFAKRASLLGLPPGGQAQSSLPAPPNNSPPREAPLGMRQEGYTPDSGAAPGTTMTGTNVRKSLLGGRAVR